MKSLSVVGACMAGLLILAGCSADVATDNPPKVPDEFQAPVALLTKVDKKDGFGDGCGPYFLVIPEATANLRLDIIMFSVESVEKDIELTLAMVVTNDRLDIVIDESKERPLAVVRLGQKTRIMLSRKDLAQAPCLQAGHRM